ncbi:MAG: hypothetical protein QOJ65_1816 [Fimbriimonadaceae bacterium]|nr:hypothetical protein [Fimbriimonadaceae bacterium]
MSLSERWDGPTTSSTFCGVEIGQAYKDLLLWEEFLNRTNPKSLIELGSWRGGMSMFLAIQCHCRSMSYVGVDVKQPDDRPAMTVQALGGRLIQADLFTAVDEEIVFELIDKLPKPLVLFCDNGNKRKEYQKFVPRLAAKDLVAVHDWGSEFYDQDRVPLLEPVMEAECRSIESITRFFRL